MKAENTLGNLISLYKSLGDGCQIRSEPMPAALVAALLQSAPPMRMFLGRKLADRWR
jgi:hypothetical protein